MRKEKEIIERRVDRRRRRRKTTHQKEHLRNQGREEG